MKRLLIALLALCSIGANEDGCAAPSGLQAGVNYCLTDPPVGCAAYCSGVDTITFTPACSHISAGPLEYRFELMVFAYAYDLESSGVQVCPQADLYNVLTPCRMGIIPQEWPGQDHEFCTPVPWGCPL